MQTLEELLVSHTTQAIVAPIDWHRFTSQLPGSTPFWLRGIVAESEDTRAAEPREQPRLLELTKGLNTAQAQPVIRQHLNELAAKILGMGASTTLDPHRPFNELGFDSLTGVEFCNAVAHAAGCPLSPVVMFDHPTIEAMTSLVMSRLPCSEQASEAAGEEDSARPTSAQADSSRTSQSVGGVPVAEDAERSRIMSEIEQLSEAEMEELVEQQLQSLKPR
jgi:hypothetical protein